MEMAGRLAMNLLFVGFGVLLYYFLITGHQHVFTKICLAELGSLGIGFGSISILKSIKQ